MREIDANVTYGGLDPEQMMNIKNSLKDQYFEKFSYRKAVALSQQDGQLDEAYETIRSFSESKDSKTQDLI